MYAYRPYEPDNPRVDLAAFVLLVLGLLIALCVLGVDGPGLTGLPAGEPIASRHLFGTLGGWVAEELFQTLGVSIYVLLIAWFVLVVLLFLRENWWIWSRRLIGWLLLVPCAALAADWVGSEQWARSVYGGGGALGAWLAHWLDQEIGPWPRGLLLIATTGIALALALDHAALVLLETLVRLGKGMGGIVRGLLRGLGPRAKRAGVEPETDRSASEPIAEPAPSAPQQTDVAIHHVENVPVVTDPEVEPAAADGYELPPWALLEDPAPFPMEEQEARLRERAALLERTFTDFGLNVKVVGINTGPVITQFEIALETGLRVNKVTTLGDDLALNLRVPSVRIVAPIPGKNTVGIEVPNDHRATVRLKELLQAGSSRAGKSRLPLFLGKDTEGRPLVYDLAEMPHLLIAGRTGTGKSVCLNAVIISLLMTRSPEEVKLILIDPKMLELSEYGRIPHLMHPVVKDMKKAEAILSWAVEKMDERYDLLSRARVRGIAAYNELTPEEIHRRVKPVDEEDAKRLVHPMPYIVIVIDELGDLMMMLKKEVEGHIIRLAQKSRAAGIHLILATQKPTVDVVTGLIKSNLPARICFQVSSRTDSRVVLDEMGADKLLGKGDMLFLQPGTSSIIRAQGTYASDDEIRRVVEFIEAEPEFAQELVTLGAGTGNGEGGVMAHLRARDELYEQAIEIVVREGRGSTSLLQRALGIGYGRAARLIDYMAEDGIVGSYNGSQAREVLLKPDRWEQMKRGEDALRESA